MSGKRLAYDLTSTQRWIHLRSFNSSPLRNDAWKTIPSFWGWVLVTFQGLCVKLQVGNDLEVFGIPKFIISTVFHLHGQIYSTSMIFRFPETTRNVSSAKNLAKQPRKKKECSHPRPKVSKKFAVPFHSVHPNNFTSRTSSKSFSTWKKSRALSPNQGGSTKVNRHLKL